MIYLIAGVLALALYGVWRVVVRVSTEEWDRLDE